MPSTAWPYNDNLQAIRVEALLPEGTTIVGPAGANGADGVDGAAGVPGAPPTFLDKNLSVYMTVGGADEVSTGLYISGDPEGWTELLINGLKETIGDAVKTKAAYFSDDGGATAKPLNTIVATDELFWNALIAGYDLTPADVIDLCYTPQPSATFITFADKNLTPTVCSGVNYLSTGLAISETPMGWIELLVDGLKETVGDGVRTKAAYFSADGGATAKSLANVAVGDVLYWNALVIGYGLTTGDILDLVYEARP